MKEGKAYIGDEIAEGNKIINDFMDEGPKGHIYDYRVNCFYHSSWDWLMPVVDDIYYSRRFPTGAQTKEISSKPNRLWLDIKNGLCNISIYQTWEAVVKFIKWYNTQNK